MWLEYLEVGGSPAKVDVSFKPDEVRVGKRVFDVSLQGKTVLRELDVARVAGGSRKAIVREFFVAVSDQELRIEISSKGERSAVISGVEWHEIP